MPLLDVLKDECFYQRMEEYNKENPIAGSLPVSHAPQS